MRPASILVLLSLCRVAVAGSPYTAVFIPVRDGQTLAADLYLSDTTQAKPVILVQTPYNKNYYRTTLGVAQAGLVCPYDSAHYNYVFVDWRGFYGSIPASKLNYDRGLDGYDVVEWIAQQPWCNGRVGTFGASALGAIQWQTARHHPPHLVCCVPMVKNIITNYGQYYYGGVYRTEHVAALSRLGFLDTATITAHPDSDLLWTATARTTDYTDSIAVPVLMIGGWFDHFPNDVLQAFADIRTRSAPSARGLHKLLIGPWLHTAIDESQQGVWQFPNAAGVAESTALAFFDYYLRNVPNEWDNGPVVRYYQMGENAWHESSAWRGEPSAEHNWYFKENGGLREEMGGGGAGPSIAADPHNPCPTVGGSRFNPFDPGIAMGPQDQRALVESRADVAMFTTDVLPEDVTVRGQVAVHVRALASSRDFDVSARLCDVEPGGASVILAQGIRRARFYTSYAREEQLSPFASIPLEIPMQDLAMTFRAGHRIRVDISGSNAPMFDVNLNNGGAMYTAGDTLSTMISIALGESRLTMDVATSTRVQSAAPVITDVRLRSVIPNPVTDLAVVTVDAGDVADARVEIVDLLGRVVATPFTGRLNPGTHTIVCHADFLPTGIYWCRMQSGRTLQHIPLEKIR